MVSALRLTPAMKAAVEQARIREATNLLVVERCAATTNALLRGRAMAEAHVETQRRGRLVQGEVRRLIDVGFHPAEAIGALGFA